MKTYHDIQGDGGSDVLGQVQAQARQIGQALAGVRRLVAIGSGKGGVGKSTVTMALAHSLSRQGRRGKRVTILDADLNGPSQARLAGLEGRPWVPGERGLVPPRRPDGIAVVSVGSLLPDAAPLAFETVSSGEQQTWRATREMALFAQILASTDWGELDVLLLDLPPGTERTVQFAQTLAGVGRLGLVMVTIPSAVARGVVARTLSALAELDQTEAGPRVLGYVENMAGYYCHACGAVRPLFPEASPGEAVPLDAPCLGRIPFDPELAALCDRGWPEDAIGSAPDRADGATADAGDGPATGLAGALRAVDAIARRLLADDAASDRPGDPATTESPNSQPDSQPTPQEAPR